MAQIPGIGSRQGHISGLAQSVAPDEYGRGSLQTLEGLVS